MPANGYEFRDQWRVPFPIGDVWDVLARPSQLPSWWRRVYLAAQPLDAAEEPSVGARVALITKGWLPYRLRWTIETTRLDRPSLIEFKAEGDFRTDSSRWVLRETEGGTEATLEWNPIVDQLVVRLLSPIARPLFRSNHVWAMRLGERQLKEYMASRGRKP